MPASELSSGPATPRTYFNDTEFPWENITTKEGDTSVRHAEPEEWTQLNITDPVVITDMFQCRDCPPGDERIEARRRTAKHRILNIKYELRIEYSERFDDAKQRAQFEGIAAELNVPIYLVYMARLANNSLAFDEAKKEAVEREKIPAKTINAEVKRIREHCGWSRKQNASRQLDPGKVVSKDERQTFCVQPGKYIVRELTDKLIGELNARRSIFYLGGPSYLSANETGPVFAPLGVPSLQVKVSEVAHIWALKAGVPIEVALPEGVARQVLSMMNSASLPVVRRMINAPTPFYVGGKMYIIKEPGYHEASGFYVLEEAQHFPGIPDAPTEGQVLESLAALWHPFKDFPFNGPNDVAGLIAALLTAVARPSMETAPGFIVIAPEQGSGKTLMGAAVGAFGSGYKVAAKPFPKDGAEMRKVLLANLRTSPSVVFFDNVRGSMDSEPLAIALTSPDFEERLLSTNTVLKVPTQTLMLLTGNNVELKGDMPRRILSIDIDPKMDDPTTRTFELAPVSYVLENRERLWCAALTILRAHNNRGVKKDAVRIASFEDWSKIVLDCVNWLATISDIGIGDAAAIIKGNREKDPERDLLGAFLESSHFITNGKPFLARDLLELVSAETVDPPRHILAKVEDEKWVKWAADKKASGLVAAKVDGDEGAALVIRDLSVKDMLVGEYIGHVKSLRESITDTNYSGGGNQNIKFGWFLKKSAGRVVGKLVLRDTGSKSHNAVLWVVGKA